MGKVTTLLKTGGKIFVKYLPQILTVAGIAGFGTATVLAIKETPEANRRIEERKKELDVEKLPPIEMVKTVAPVYWPFAATALVSTACIAGSNIVSTKRQVALMGAYALAESTLKDYKAEVIETLGEKKERAVRERIEQKKVESNPVIENDIFYTNLGDTLFYDGMSGRYFKHDIHKIKQAINRLNEMLLGDMYVSLTEFYDEMGLPPTDISDEIGWNIDDGLIDCRLPAMKTDNDEPCLSITPEVLPRWDYHSIY